MVGAVDVLRHLQKMWIMDVVWPMVALFGTVTVWPYWRGGKLSARDAEQAARERGEQPPYGQLAAAEDGSQGKDDMPVQQAEGAEAAIKQGAITHCRRRARRVGMAWRSGATVIHSYKR